MKAVVFSAYGGPEVLLVEEIEKPVPNEDQLLLRVHASSINAGDYRTMRATPFILRLMMGGLGKPKDKRMGSDLAGTVEQVGANVTQFKVGDEVFGCRSGAFAEYVITREGLLAHKPANLTFEQAAAVPVAALTALQGLRDTGQIQPGQKVLIQGASGGVGMFAVQLAKSFGAQVTGVCSPRNIELVRSWGADHVIDYTKEDFTRGNECYDLIYAVNGYHSLSAYKRALCPKGRYVSAGGTLRQIFEGMLLGRFFSEKDGKKLTFMGIAKVEQADLNTLAVLLSEGKIAPHIDRSYPLSEIAPAMRYVEDTHAQGKVVISMGA
jgi:NADPH:quinone reductase-like Zn-dependent oxidoreductase